MIRNGKADSDEGEACQPEDFIEFSQGVGDADFAEENGLDCFHVESFCYFVVTRIEHQVEHDDLERDLFWVNVVGDGHVLIKILFLLLFLFLYFLKCFEIPFFY